MNVLSLFDGMSCGRLALERANIPVTKYYSSEIDKFAIQVSEANYPDNIRLGDVTTINYENLPTIDLLIGGSPCQGFSFAGKRLNFDDPRSMLFFEYVKALKTLKPKYFLLENVVMKKEYQDIISEHLGCQPIKINSSLMSAQSRNRLYWTNIPDVGQPDDLGIRLEDIIQPESDIPDNMYHTDKAIAYMERGNPKWQQAGDRRADRYLQTHEKEKAFCLTANFYKGVPYNYVDFTRCGQMIGRKINPDTGKRDDYNPNIKTKQRVEIREDDKTGALTTVQKDNLLVGKRQYRKLTPIECERLQTVPDNFTNHVSNTQRFKMLGNGWTISIIAHILEGI